MPKLARYTLIWSAEDERYELRERGGSTSYPLQEDDSWWPGWLAEHSSFSFQGRQGHLNLLKEARARGADYWYAYRSLNRRTTKKYAGRTADLTIAHLEELTGAFTHEATPQTQDMIQQASVTVIPKTLSVPGATAVQTHSLTSFSGQTSTISSSWTVKTS